MAPLRLTVLGLSLSSSWGNGHATTYRALLRAFAQSAGTTSCFWNATNPGTRISATSSTPTIAICASTPTGGTARASRPHLPERRRHRRLLSCPTASRWATGCASCARGVTAFYDIDTPVTLAKLERGDYEYIPPDLIPRYDLYLSFTGGPTLRTLERRYGSPAARALYCSVDGAVPASRPRSDL